MFATPADVLARTNPRRLAQLAIPADNEMPPTEALRVAINGGDLTVYTTAQQTALSLGIAAINGALSDANQLMLGYGVPATAASTLIARLCTTVALYYLQGTEKVTEDVLRAYHSAVDTLKAFKRGDIELVPTAATAVLPGVDLVLMSSQRRRYFGFASADAFFNEDILDDAGFQNCSDDTGLGE